MRILLFSGKGGVGKTSLAAATGVKLAELNHRTLVMSIDPAHSLADAFDLCTDLFHVQTSDPLPINDRLSIQELNIQKEIKRHWQEISSYVSSVLRTTGISSVEAEELAILPGMEELSAMMWVNTFRREKRYDVIVLDCAPTAESMRFISMPTTLEWYMRYIFPLQRGAEPLDLAQLQLDRRVLHAQAKALAAMRLEIVHAQLGYGLRHSSSIR